MVDSFILLRGPLSVLPQQEYQFPYCLLALTVSASRPAHLATMLYYITIFASRHHCVGTLSPYWLGRQCYNRRPGVNFLSSQLPTLSGMAPHAGKKNVHPFSLCPFSSSYGLVLEEVYRVYQLAPCSRHEERQVLPRGQVDAQDAACWKG